MTSEETKTPNGPAGHSGDSEAEHAQADDGEAKHAQAWLGATRSEGRGAKACPARREASADPSAREARAR